jgi:hypothetical protein
VAGCGDHRWRQAEAAFKEAVRKAIERHRRLGIPIAYMQDGKVVIVEPEAITPTAPAAGEHEAPRRE